MADKSYVDALHAMQSGVAAEIGIRSEPTDPKHLRVGINSAMSDHTGLVKLLIKKGVITEEEYFEAIKQEMNLEVGRYEKRLSAHFGRDVFLH